MPVYEYECQAKACGHTFDEYQTLHDAPLKKCKICKKGKVIKLISITARPVVPGHPLDEIVKIKQDAKRQAKEILRGNQDVIADVLGESAITGKVEPKKATTSKAAPKIKRSQ